ncbi:hypothetical protein [Photobacterium leiognathi]|uniref:hypothetical protein n=1 Tax=Photobacterium leiognathi TaxID=553611 RepID=UPI0027394DD7|nr:hypothetical protein [Photobacterium leiognathi]
MLNGNFGASADWRSITIAVVNIKNDPDKSSNLIKKQKDKEISMVVDICHIKWAF